VQTSGKRVINEWKPIVASGKPHGKRVVTYGKRLVNE